MTDVLILAAVLGVALMAAGLWKRRDGRVRTTDGSLDGDVRNRVGIPPGRPALLLFSTPTCATCPAARDVLRAVADERPGVLVGEVDVAEHPDLARTMKVLRSPTVLVVDASDEIRVRVSGVPDRAELSRAVPAG